MAFDVRVQNVLEKKTGMTDCGVVKKPGLTARVVATGVTKFHIASGGLSLTSHHPSVLLKLRINFLHKFLHFFKNLIKFPSIFKKFSFDRFSIFFYIFK